MSAGRDLNIASTTSSASNYTEGTTVNNFSLTGIDRIAGLYVTSQTGTTLVASAGRDANIVAGVIANNGATSNTTVTAQRDLNLGTVGTSSSSSVVRGAGTDFLEDRQTADVGSQINTQGNLNLSAGRDLNTKAASVQAAGDLTAVAGNNINISNGRQTSSASFGLTSNDGDLFSSTSSTERRSGEQSNAVGSSIGGKTITSVAGNDQTITGSSVISDAGTTLSAGKNLTIQAATNTSKSSDFKETKEEGLMSSGGAGVTIGSQEQSLEQKRSGTTAAASTVGSITGNVTLVANEAYKQVGSDVMAPGGDVTIVAKKVDIVEARETSRSETEQKFKQSGLTFEVTSPIISAMQTMSQMSEAANNTSDSRMKGLAAANSALAINNVANAVKAGQGTRMNGKDGQIATGGTNPDGTPASRDSTEADKAGGINLAISIGSSSSQSNSLSQSDTARGSTVTAGGTVTIAATGAGQESNLTIQGSTVEAQRAVQLLADNQVNLLAAQNTASQNSTNSSKSGSIGISFGTDGFLVNASASKGKGRADGEDTFYTNTQVKAGQQVSITSGGDTTLQGAVVKAEQIKADVGGNLLIKSLQDSSTYTSSQQSMGGSVSVGFGKMSGSVSASKSNIDSNFNSVGQQSGIKAGDGGFQVNVSGNTTLNGSVIASNQAAVEQGKNSFQTGGTLNIGDIQNSASYDAKSVSISVGTSQQPTGKLGMSGLGLGLGSDKANASSTSSAGISGIAGNTAVRSTDAETGLQKIFDAEKVQREINARTQITQYFGQQASKAVGDYAQTKLNEAFALRDQAENETNEERKNALRAEAKGLEDNWGSKGVLRLALHTVIGGLTGGTDGALGAAAGTLTAPMVAQALADAGVTGPLAQTLTAIASTAVGAAIGGAAGGAAAGNEVVNNFLKHDQAAAMKAEMAACKAKTGGCTDAQERALRDKYILLSNANIEKIKSLIVAGDVGGIQKLEGEAAGNAEVVGIFSTRWDEEIFTNRQTNINIYGSIYGTSAIYGNDIQRAQDVSIFRSGNCQGLSPTACNGLVQDALDYQAYRVGLLGVIGVAVPLTVKGLQAWKASLAPSGTPSKTGTNPVVGDGDLDNVYSGQLGGKPVVISAKEAAANAAAAASADKVTAPIDFAHVIGADSNRRGPTGGHSTVNGDVKVVQVVNAPDVNGVYEAKVQMKDASGNWVDKVSNRGVNTMFPSSWTADRIKFEIDAAWNSTARTSIIGPGGVPMWRSVTPSGVVVEGYVSPRITAYPKYGVTN